MKPLRIKGSEAWIRDGDLIEEDLTAAHENKEIGWDIETSGLNWRNNKIGTCQVYIPTRGVIIVRINNNIPHKLRYLLKEKSIRKVFHHAMFDLRFMSFHWNVLPNNVACTKIAAKLLDVENKKENHLKALLKRYLGIEISKKMRVSNWFSTELTRNQLLYAAKDAMYLLPLLAKLEKELERKKLLLLAKACFAYIPTRVQLDICGYHDIYKY